MDRLFGKYYIRDGNIYSLEKLHRDVSVVTLDSLAAKKPRAPTQLEIDAPNIFFVSAAWRNTVGLRGCCVENVGLLDKPSISNLVGPMWNGMELFD